MLHKMLRSATRKNDKHRVLGSGEADSSTGAQAPELGGSALEYEAEKSAKLLFRKFHIFEAWHVTADINKACSEPFM